MPVPPAEAATLLPNLPRPLPQVGEPSGGPRASGSEPQLGRALAFLLGLPPACCGRGGAGSAG